MKGNSLVERFLVRKVCIYGKFVFYWLYIGVIFLGLVVMGKKSFGIRVLDVLVMKGVLIFLCVKI